MSKKITIAPKPTSTQQKTNAADDWVSRRHDTATEMHSASTQEKVPVKRLTIDISADLHRHIKASCAMRGTRIADEIRQLLIKHFDYDPSASS